MPAQNPDRSYDAIVVGAGVIGLACAWRLAAAGGRVVAIERSTPPAGATRVAAGMLAPVGELQFGEDALLEMSSASARMYPDFAARLEAGSGRQTGYRRCGALHVALDRDEAAELRRVHGLQRARGLEAEWLGPQGCRRLEPGLTPSFHGGVHVPGDGVVDPRTLTAALVEALRRAGGELRVGEEVEELLTEGERVLGVRAGVGERILAPVVVVASGAWAGTGKWLPDWARPPVRPVKGQIIELRGTADDPVCDRIVASERVYLVPRLDGRLIVGATVEERGFETVVTAGGVHELLREAYRLLPEIAELELVEVAAGLRPGTPDNLPLIGPGAVEGLMLATGHYRNGILLAALTAEAVAAALSGGRVPPEVAAADPARLGAVEPVGAQR